MDKDKWRVLCIMLIDSVFHTPDSSELASPLYLTWAGHRICQKNHSIGPRVLPNFKMVLVVEGSGFFSQRNTEKLIRTGDLFFCFPDVIHHYYANSIDPWTIKWFSFNGSGCKKIMESLGATADNPFFTDCLSTRLLSHVDNIIDSLKQNNAYSYDAIGYSYLFFSELLKVRSNEGQSTASEVKDDELLEKILIFIQLNYANAINIDLVASHVNYSRSYVSHFIKRKIGTSLPQFVNDLRVRRACELLDKTTMNNNEISMSIGYNDPLYFIKVFKKHMMMTPQRYRQYNPLAVFSTKVTNKEN